MLAPLAVGRWALTSPSAIRVAALSTSRSCSQPLPARNWKIPAGYPEPEPLAPAASETFEAGPSKPLADDLPPPVERRAPKEPTPREYVAHTKAMKDRFPKQAGISWNPPRKLSRQAIEGLRTLHRHDPDTFSTPMLAERFKISAEAVRRILKSRWEPSREERMRMAERDKAVRDEWIKKRREEEMLNRKMMRAERDPKDRLTLR
jgi:hypothetical protein